MFFSYSKFFSFSLLLLLLFLTVRESRESNFKCFYQLIEQISSRWSSQNSMHLWALTTTVHAPKEWNLCRSRFSIHTYTYIYNIYFVILSSVRFSIFVRCANPHKITIYYIYDTNTRWLLSCSIRARMYKFTNEKKKIESLKDVLFRAIDRLYIH